MNNIWQINNPKALILLFQIAFRNGLKIGDRPNNSDWQEVYLRHTDWIKHLGVTELNTEELLQEYASHGKRVLYIKKASKLDK